MTQFGVFARTWSLPTAAEIGRAAVEAGFDSVQWNYAAIGQPTLASGRGPAQIAATARELNRVGVRLWGLSATFNILFPGEVGAIAVDTIRAAGDAGVRYVTVCTGTNDTESMWRAHPANSSEESWQRMRAGLEPLLDAAAAAGVTIGVEPERANVVSDAARAKRLLDEVGWDAPIGIVLDPANLVTPVTVADQEQVLTLAFQSLATKVVCVHAKDVVTHGYAAAGVGLLDYHLIARLHKSFASAVPVVSQDASAQDAARVARFLHETWAAA